MASRNIGSMTKMKYLLILVVYSIIIGCASKGSYTPSGAYIKDIDKSLQSGDIRLICDTSCSGAWGAKRKQLKGLYENELWKDLALTVGKLGFRSDQTYYYLGRSAEGLGYIDAARTYYKLSKASYKCHGFINNCDGLIFPKAVDMRLNSLPVPQKIIIPLKSEDQALEVVMLKSEVGEEDNNAILSGTSVKNNIPKKTRSKNINNVTNRQNNSKSAHRIDKNAQNTISSPLVKKPLKTNNVYANNSFNSIGGYTLGQLCAGPQFSKTDSSVRNPNDVLDKIIIKRNIIKKKLKGGYDLRVECGILDNKVNYLSLTSDESDDISNIKDSLRGKMGRPADDRDEIKRKPMNLLGIIIDGTNMETEKWFLSDTKTATAYTIITIPYGTSSISDLKWKGGIELSINERSLSEWNHLKQKGHVSSKQSEALNEKKRKDRIRGLLE